jgi:hypothetical protein
MAWSSTSIIAQIRAEEKKEFDGTKPMLNVDASEAGCQAVAQIVDAEIIALGEGFNIARCGHALFPAVVR